MSQCRYVTTIETEEGDREIVIMAEFCPAERGDTDGPRGPKLSPDIPAHWEINDVTFADNGHDVPEDVYGWEAATEHVNGVTAPGWTVADRSIELPPRGAAFCV